MCNVTYPKFPCRICEKMYLAKIKVQQRHGVVIITTAQLNSTKLELRFCTGSNPARSVLEICDSEDL